MFSISMPDFSASAFQLSPNNRMPPLPLFIFRFSIIFAFFAITPPFFVYAIFFRRPRLSSFRFFRLMLCFCRHFSSFLSISFTAALPPPLSYAPDAR